MGADHTRISRPTRHGSRFCIAGALLLVFAACSKGPDLKAEAVRLENTLAGGETNAHLALALSAIRSEDRAGALIALENAKRVPGMTPEQLMAVHEAMRAMTADLLQRAERGDVKAQADLAAIERSRSQ